VGRYLRVNTENAKIAEELLRVEGGREAVVAMGFSVQEGAYYKLAADVTNDHLNKCSAEVPQQTKHDPSPLTALFPPAQVNRLTDLITLEMIEPPRKKAWLTTQHKGLELLKACFDGNLELVRGLLAGGADKDAANNDGATPLSVACQQGYLEVVRLLIESGADTEKAMDDEWSPLYLACEKGYLEVVKLLIERGADKDKAMDGGVTPLCMACQEGHFEVVRLLIESGADTDKAKNIGATPLFMACEKGYPEMARLLIDGGADMEKAMDLHSISPQLPGRTRGRT
jgi:ankyrin repeat protein